MKFLIFVMATPDSEAGVMPTQELIDAMTAFNHELVAAGIMQDGDGLKPSSNGARVAFSGANRTVRMGPFANTSDIVAGYWIWTCKSLEEAVSWVKRAPNPMPGYSEIEIRPCFEMEDFAAT